MNRQTILRLILYIAVTGASIIPMATVVHQSSCVYAANVASSKWLLSYRGETTNRVRWDSRFPELLDSGLPHIHASFYNLHDKLPKIALDALSGTPDPVAVESDRYVTLAAVVPEVGELKGLLWIDTEAPLSEMIFAALNQDPAKTNQASLALYTRSTAFTRRLPPQFTASLRAWLSRKGITKITQFTMTNSSGQSSTLPLTVLGLQ